ncbi:MAG: hypothetical protein K2I31_01335 [Duncaniella sp.]|nr:hypothetical protein [Duncaniella sp.]MDE5673570.1 hypothetical protein [Duncaniella sp.]MDE5962074.1 hypothetical protein [Duncaniella sp.]
MKTFRIILGTLMAASAIGINADSKTSTVIDGIEIDKDITKLKFNGNTVTLSFSDNSSIEADMKFVSIKIRHATSAIDDVIADPQKPSGIYNLKGQYLGTNPKNLSAGFYIVNGQKVYVK